MLTPLRARWAAWVLLLLLFGGAAPALQAQGVFRDPTCATPEPTEAEARQAYEAVRAWLQQHPTPPEGGVVTIPVAFHVIYSGGQGNVPESQVTAQIERFNAEFAPFGYRFVLAVLDRTENAQWFVVNSATETPMKLALAIDPARFLNIYTANLQGGLLGWAYFPNSFPENMFLHGVVIHYQTLPGGSFPGYGTGDTAVHEVGHYVGLYHTFQGGCAGGDTPPGCETGGDQVCDTAAQSAPTWNCPPGYNSCPTGGPDPLNNFMSYAGDACLFEFTDGQNTRALALMTQYRPTIMSNPAGFASPQALDFGDVGVGDSRTRIARVVNLTDDPLAVTSITTDNAAFTTDVTSLTVPALSAAEVEVTFTPTVNGPETGTLTLETTNPDIGTLTIALEGEGVDFVAALGLRPNGLAAAAPVGGTDTGTFEISDEGVAPLEYEFVSIPPWISSIAPNPGTVEPGEEVEATVTLSAAGLGVGVEQDLLGLTTNDPENDELALHVVFAVGGAFPPPAIVGPLYGRDDVPIDYTLAWLGVPDAEEYAVEVAEDEDFTTIVESEVVDRTSVSFTGEAGATLYWRVRSVDGTGTESDWSITFVFTVANPVANEPDGTPPVPSALGAIYPNPTRGAVTVPFSLEAAGTVTLRAYDVTGRLVATLADGQPYAAGAHVLRWETRSLPAGVYFVRLLTAKEAAAQKVVLLR